MRRGINDLKLPVRLLVGDPGQIVEVHEIRADAGLLLVDRLVDGLDVARGDQPFIQHAGVPGKQGVLVAADLFCLCGEVFKDDTAIQIVIGRHDILNIAAGPRLLERQRIQQNIGIGQRFNSIIEDLNGDAGVFGQLGKTGGCIDIQRCDRREIVEGYLRIKHDSSSCKKAGRCQPARRWLLTVRMCGYSCGRGCTESRNWRECRFRQKQLRSCGALPNRRGHSRCRGRTSSVPYCSDSTHDRRSYGSIHICRRTSAMLPR